MLYRFTLNLHYCRLFYQDITPNLTAVRVFVLPMYKDYFGLKEEPFAIAPDPQFLFMSECHREALAHLIYGIKSAGGFVLLTGEVGTGKTTVCRCLLGQVPENSEIAFVLNPKLSVVELLETVCDELAIKYPQGNRSNKVFIDAINRFLLAAHSRGRKTILIIDEAQNLSAAVLEQIRLLTNLETNKQKLLQVIMLGQPELKLMLERPELRQLAQRITARYHLESLAKNEIKDYINHRLAVAGVERSLFPARTIAKLYQLSGGVPRLINLLCDRALLGAYVKEQSQVSPALLAEASREVFGGRRKPQSYRYPTWQWLLLLVVVIGALLLVPTAWFRPPPPATAPVEATVPLPQLDRLEWDEQQPLAQSKLLAYQALFDLWGVSYGSVQGSDRDQAASNGLSLLSKRDSFGRLRQLNRPAVLKLINSLGQDYYVTLMALSDATATLVIGKRRRIVPITELSAQWFGEFTLLWQLPPDYTGVLKPGAKGIFVQWLDQQMATLNGRSAQVGENLVFTGQLLEEIQRFQSTEGLVPDGVVGPYTLIQLNSRISALQPTLSAGKKG
jgi:general secretion pathway protein A